MKYYTRDNLMYVRNLPEVAWDPYRYDWWSREWVPWDNLGHDGFMSLDEITEEEALSGIAERESKGLGIGFAR